jgi:hypothetical protein
MVGNTALCITANLAANVSDGSRTDQSATSALGLLICTEQTLEHCEIGSVKRENRDLPRQCEHLVGARAAWAEFPPCWRNGKL